MTQLWLLKGDYEAPGWKKLRKDNDDKTIDIVHLDPMVWALIRAETAPEGYEDLSAGNPPDGMYVDPNGSPVFVTGNQIATEGPMQVIRGLGPEAEAATNKLGDPLLVLERLGRAF